LIVILTPRGQPIIDGTFGVDHAGGLKPFPFSLRPINIIARVAGNAIGQMRRNGEKQLIGDGVDIRVR
jgi:hypothetical protein